MKIISIFFGLKKSFLYKEKMSVFGIIVLLSNFLLYPLFELNYLLKNNKNINYIPYKFKELLLQSSFWNVYLFLILSKVFGNYGLNLSRLFFVLNGIIPVDISYRKRYHLCKIINLIILSGHVVNEDPLIGLMIHLLHNYLGEYYRRIVIGKLIKNDDKINIDKLIEKYGGKNVYKNPIHDNITDHGKSLSILK